MGVTYVIPIRLLKRTCREQRPSITHQRPREVEQVKFLALSEKHEIDITSTDIEMLRSAVWAAVQEIAGKTIWTEYFLVSIEEHVGHYHGESGSVDLEWVTAFIAELPVNGKLRKVYCQEDPSYGLIVEGNPVEKKNSRSALRSDAPKEYSGLFLATPENEAILKAWRKQMGNITKALGTKIEAGQLPVLELMAAVPKEKKRASKKA